MPSKILPVESECYLTGGGGGTGGGSSAAGCGLLHPPAPEETQLLVIILQLLEQRNSHERPAEEADRDHWQPGGHQREVVESMGQGSSQAGLRKPTVEGVESTLIGLGVLVQILRGDLGNIGGSGRSAIQRNVAHGRRRPGLVWQSLGDGEPEYGWRANCPGIAKDWLSLAVDNCKVGRIGPRGDERDGFL